ncbi:glycosyltransferase [Phenylobacterium sp.]|uniref:glycosyltransferase n=1 Tax=Phenylobacterium sp. TaxID=1871053 RepID=UPI002FC72ECD
MLGRRRGFDSSDVGPTPFLLYGVLFFCLGIASFLLGVLLVFPRYLLDLHELLDPVAEWLVWYSGVPIVLGLTLAGFDLLFLLGTKKPNVPVRYEPVANPKVTVALTAYDDEESIGPAVKDFLAHPRVARVIVVSNNSADRTFERAEAAGAITFNEAAPGYGRCVYRCLSEAVKFTDSDVIVLCEGDLTFRAFDIDKLAAYVAHADIVNGTRTVEPLRQYITQLSTFMFYGNIFVGKLLEAKYLGRGTITDAGTTYKLCRREALERLLPHLNPAVNLEFNAHFLDTALRKGLVLIECPITFHARVGVSKGGNINDLRGFIVGCRMIVGIVFGWRLLT